MLIVAAIDVTAAQLVLSPAAPIMKGMPILPWNDLCVNLEQVTMSAIKIASDSMFESD